MPTKLVQEIIDSLGAEVVTQAPKPMEWDRGKTQLLKNSVQRCSLCNAKVDSSFGQRDVLLLLDGEKFPEEELRRLEICGFLDVVIVHSMEFCKQHLHGMTSTFAPKVILALDKSCVSLGFDLPPDHLAGRTAIWWANEVNTLGCFVLFLPRASLSNKSWWLSQLYKLDRYLTGEDSPWDFIGRGPCVGQNTLHPGTICRNHVSWIDQNGLPYCRGHKVLPEKPKTKARRRERIR